MCPIREDNTRVVMLMTMRTTGLLCVTCWLLLACPSASTQVSESAEPALRDHSTRAEIVALRCPFSESGCVSIFLPSPPWNDCRGGDFYVDGEAQGEYPVRLHPVPPGLHQIHIASANDCAGYGSLDIDVVPGEHYVLEPNDFHF